MNETTEAKISRIDERTVELLRRMDCLENKFDSMTSTFLTRKEFTPYRNAIVTVIGVVFVSVIYELLRHVGIGK